MEGKSKERETSPSPVKNEDEEEVMSEVHLGCPPNLSGPFISHFSFPLPPPGDEHEPGLPKQLVQFDEDGDLIVPRRTKQSCNSASVSIRHNITSTIPNVGLQVWQAELVLADYVLHNMLSSSIFNGVIAVELGAGTGLVGMLIAHVAATVFITDHGDEILHNCVTNVHANSRMFRSGSTVKVRELNWLNPWPPLDLDFESRFSWKSSEVEEVNKASVLLAADVIYSDELTDALFSILQKLMYQGSQKVLYLALEKRYNFSLHDFDVVANGYSHFCSYLTEEKGFVGKCLDLSDIPQYVKEYDRGSDIELWEIKYAGAKF